MKTKKSLNLFLAVFAIVPMLVSFYSVGFAADAHIQEETIQIKISNEEWICIDLNLVTGCPIKVSTSTDYCNNKTTMKPMYLKREEFFGKHPASKFKVYREYPCDTRIFDIDGNTICVNTPWGAYCR
jgi:hypothetical protein